MSKEFISILRDDFKSDFAKNSTKENLALAQDILKRTIQNKVKNGNLG